MKPCSVCKREKELSDYFFRDKKSGRLHSQCKACYTERRKKNWKEYYYRQGSTYRARAVERSKKLKIALRSNMLDYLSDKSCVHCGNNDVRVLEFDHIDPNTKSFSIARGVANVLSWDKLLVEIKKCQILCANCHKVKTAEEQGWYKSVA